MSIQVRSDDVIIVCGKRRSGKSYFFRVLMKPFKRRIIWDYNWEHGDMGYIVHFPNRIAEAMKKNLFHIVFQPINKTLDDFRNFLRAVQNFHNVVFGIEEVERYAEGGKKSYMPPELRIIIDTGRHKAQGVVCTVRRINRVHQDIPANADHIFVFHQHRPQDLDLLREWMGEEIYKLKTLQPYFFIHYDDGEGETVVRKPV